MDGEVLEDLNRLGLKIIRAPGTYAYTADSVLLADFAGVKDGDRVCDLGAGDGILPLLLYGRCPRMLCDGVEKDAAAAARAARSVLYNHMEDAVRIHCATFAQARALLPAGAYSLVVSNPPYFDAPCAREKRAPERTLTDLLSFAALLLRHHGRLALCFPAARLTALLPLLRENALEPKALRFVYGKPSKDAYLCLIRCVKNARPGLAVAPPLCLRGEDGRETEEVSRIYGMS